MHGEALPQGPKGREAGRKLGQACGQGLALPPVNPGALVQKQPLRVSLWAAGARGSPGPPTHLGELLLQLLPLLAVGLAQLLPLPDQQAQLAQGP